MCRHDRQPRPCDTYGQALQRFDVWIEPALIAEWSRLISLYAEQQRRSGVSGLRALSRGMAALPLASTPACLCSQLLLPQPLIAKLTSGFGRVSAGHCLAVFPYHGRQTA